MKNKKLIYLIIFGLMLNIISGVVSGNVFFNDTDVYLHCDDNETYKVDTTQPFNHIVVDGDFVQFNNTAFRCDFDEDVNVTLLFLNVLEPYGNLTILSFTYEQGNGVSLHDFNLSGFLTSSSYQVYTNKTLLTEVVSSGVDGWVNFTSDILFGRVDIVWYPLILFSQINGEGAGRGEIGGDYLYDEVPLNNSFHWFNQYGWTTGISVDYTNFNHGDVQLYENMIEPFHALGAAKYSSQTFEVETESYYLVNISANMLIPVGGQHKFWAHVCTLNDSKYPTTNYISTGFAIVTGANESGSYEFVNVNMSSAYLEYGSNYGIVLYWDLNITNSLMAWTFRADNHYLNGSRFTSNDGITYINQTDTDFLFKIYGSNIGTLVNLSFDWYNDSLGDWQTYAYVPIAMNMTYNFHNYNFSGIDTYIWRVTAVANDTGVTHSETYQFTTFVLTEDIINRAGLALMLPCTSFIVLFWLMWKRRHKKDEKQNIY